MTTYTYPLQFLDFEAVSIDAGTNVIPFTVGSSFQANDVRLTWVVMNNQGGSGTPTLTLPSGYSSMITSGGSFTYGTSMSKKTLTATSVDQTATCSVAPVGGSWRISVTIRFFGGNTTPITPWTNFGAGGSTTTLSSVTAGQDGAALQFMMGNPSSPTFLAPSGYTQIGVDSPGADGSTSAGLLFLFGESRTSGSTGSSTIPISGTGNQLSWTQGVFINSSPDLNATISTATTETDTAAVTTASLLNSVSFTIGTATAERDTASQMFTPLTGYRISPPLALPQSPITNSIISWTTLTPAAGSTAKVETSVDGGLTWQTPVNNGAVPRLTFGTNFVQTVMTRVTLNRLVKTDASPSVPFLQVSVATDASHDELVPLGTFLITATDIEMVGGGATGGGGSGGGGDGITGSGGGNNGGGGPIVTLTGVDLSREVSRRKWEDIYFISINTNYAMAIMEMVDNRLPGLQYNFTSTPETVQSTLIYGDETGTDPWQDAQDLATDIGCQLFFDAAGVCTLRPVPDPATTGSVWEFSDTMNPVIASVTRSLTDESTYNYVIVQGEQSGDLPPVQAIAFDDDPNSITYYLGKYGIKPVTYTSAAITTQAQAQEAANAILLAVKGASETVTLNVSPMPALEPGDVITVTIAGVKASGDYLVQEVTTPISAAEAQTFVLYRQTA